MIDILRNELFRYQSMVFELMADEHPAIAAILSGFAWPVAGNIYLTTSGERYANEAT
jgi:hypothetical protein